MAIAIETLRTAVMADPDCGPSLELEGDRDYFNFLARAEGLFPQSFFEFDRASIDYDAETRSLVALLSRSVDLGLMAALAKVAILGGDFRGFVAVVSLVRDVLRDRWETVHPRPQDFGVEARWAALQALDDAPQVVFPLQSAPLLPSRRIGALTYRSVLLSAGKIQPRRIDGGESQDKSPTQEKVPTPADIVAAFAEADAGQLEAARLAAAQLADAVSGIEAVCDEKASPGALRLPKLKEIAFGINAVLAGEGEEKPSVGVDGSATEATPKAEGGTHTLEQALEDLQAAQSYFAAREPSSPARLVIALARSLVGKSLIEVIAILAPDSSGQASIKVPNAGKMALPLKGLATLLTGEIPQKPVSPPPPPTGTETAPSEGGASDSGAIRPAARAPIVTRADAIDAMSRASAYFSSNEPSSPIPLLLERARSTVGRDFVTVLRDILPALMTGS